MMRLKRSDRTSSPSAWTTAIAAWVALAALFPASRSFSSSSIPGAVSNPAAPGQVGWLINFGAYGFMTQLGSSATVLANQYFGNSKTYCIVSKNTNLSSVAPGCIPTLTFTSFADNNGILGIQSALASGSIPSHIQAILYDNENWAFTPLKEQQNPALYYQLAGQLVHQHHLQFVATPASNLVKSIEPSFTGPVYPEFIRLGIPGAAARYADVYEIQAQGSEMSSNTFTAFVSGAAAQAQRANPQVQVYAGISTGPTGQTVTVAQLFAAVQATLGVVSGYWLNIPEQSPYCPSCGVANPQLAVELLQQMQSYAPQESLLSFLKPVFSTATAIRADGGLNTTLGKKIRKPGP